MKQGVVSFWRRLAAAAATLLFGALGMSCREKGMVERAAPPPVGLLPNPAYRLQWLDAYPTLVANAGRPDEVRYRLDAASLALWEVLMECVGQRAPEKEAPPPALSEAEVVRRMQARFADQPADVVAEGVRRFLKMAMAEGIVVRTDGHLRFEAGNQSAYIDYQPPKGADGSR